MSLRWPKYLPRFPAILLMPTVLTAWALLLVKQSEIGPGWGSNFPLSFTVVELDVVPGKAGGWSIIGVWGFLVDTSLALAAAYAVAMYVERMLFAIIRTAREGKQGQEDSK